MLVDCLEPIELADESVQRFHNRLSSLRRLSTGLRFLYEQVKDAEGKFGKKSPPDAKVVLMGRLPGMTNEQRGLLECFFQWYAVSVCNFVRAIGWFRYTDKQSEQALRKYIERIVPGPLSFRDKVGAHAAATCFKDNLAEKAASVMPQVGWSDSRFYASEMTLFIRHGNETEGRDSTGLERWSLTEVHEELINRYPHLKM